MDLARHPVLRDSTPTEQHDGIPEIIYGRTKPADEVVAESRGIGTPKRPGDGNALSRDDAWLCVAAELSEEFEVSVVAEAATVVVSRRDVVPP